MMKIHLGLLASILLSCFISAGAQSLPGSWYSVPTFGAAYKDVIETPGRTYLLADGFLMSVSDSETIYYDSSNKLSDYNISVIRYNFDKGYLFIAYSNGNIDLLYDDGHIVNMPDLKDASVATSRQINSIDFGNDRIVLATQFGIVVYDDEKHEVVESGIFNEEVRSAMIMGDRLVLYTQGKLFWAPLGARHPNMDYFQPVLTTGGEQAHMWDNIARCGENSFIRRATTPANSIYRYVIDGNNVMTSSFIGNSQGNTFCYGKDFVAVTTSWDQAIVDATGNITKVSIPAELRGTASFNTAGAASVWVTGPKGFANFDFSAATPTVLADWAKPQASPVVRVAQLVWSADGQDLYVNSICSTPVIETGPSVMQTCIMHRDGSIENISSTGNVPRDVLPDSDYPDMFYLSYGYNSFGVYSHEGIVKNMTDEFVPFPMNSDVKCTASLTIDPEGNLWGVCYASSDDNPLIVLPDNIRSNRFWENPKLADWKTHPLKLTERYTHFGSHLVFHPTKPYAILTNTTFDGGYVVLNHNGTLTDFSDDTYVDHIGIVDQSGSRPGGSHALTCIATDNNGAFWLGSGSGVFVISDPVAAMSQDYTLTRPLVARNDGTIYGDYLLATDKIYCIAVDHSNRKWIGTEASGLYLVSEDGSEILEHFTETNSPLPTNSVYSVSVDPLGSAVYVGTEAGLFVYNGDSSPAADDYSNVFVYPNPVRPEYTGPVTITGLMENSLVKIADVSGNVIYQGRSEGGSMTWDVCNSAGQRVRTGVYFVLASQSAGGSSGAVAKITVIN